MNPLKIIIRYNLTPIRLLVTIINKAVDAHTFLISSEATIFSRKLFELSLTREGNGRSANNRMTAQPRARENDMIEDIFAEEEEQQQQQQEEESEEGNEEDENSEYEGGGEEDHDDIL